MSGWAHGFHQDGSYGSSGAMEGRPGVVWGPPGNRPSPKQTPAGPGGGGACGGVGDRAWTRWVRPGSVWGKDTARRVNIRGTPRAAGDGPAGEVRGSWSRAVGPGGGAPAKAVLLRGHNG